MTICSPGLAGLSDFQPCDVPFRLTIKINQCFLTEAARGELICIQQQKDGDR